MADGEPKVSSDGLTYTVKLKSGLKWSDGTPLTADDFVAGLQRTCNPTIAGNYEYIMTDVVGCDDYYTKKGTIDKVGVRAVDPQTVEYKLIQPQPTFPILLAMWPTFPTPRQKVATVDAAWPGPMDNAYNGPFMPSAYTEKDHIDLVPNPNYTGDQKPQVTKITIKYIDDLSVAENAYRNGEVDAATANNANLLNLQKDSTLSKELVDYPSTRTTAIEYNVTDPALSNVKLRLALSEAVDRVALNTVANKGANIPSTSWMPPARSGVAAGAYDSLIGFNATKAKADLQASGVDPKSLKLSVVFSDTPTNHDIGAFLQNAWKTNLGIDVATEFVDAKTRSARFNSMQYTLFIGGWQEDYPDPENWILGQFETGSSQNKFGTADKALDAAIAKAKYETNDETRRKEYQDIEKMIITNVDGIAPLYQNGNHKLVKPYISGMKENKRPSDSFVPGDWSMEFWKTSKK
jgi:oligopeptide transport system substrate-binding protein